MEKNIAVIKGDGIGPEIVTEAMKVLDAVAKKYNHKFNYTEILMGGCSIDAYGVPLSDEALKIAKESDSVLLGAIGGNTTTSPWYKLEPSLRPEAGLLKIRKELGLFANLRPAYLYDELKGACPLKEELTEGGFDMMIMRELTGGLYFGERSTEKEGDQMVAHDSMSYSESEIRRIAKRGFDIAMKRNKKVTSVDKANVLDTSRLWRKVVEEVAKEYPEVTLEHMLVDNCAMQLVRDPKQFDVILTENMFGDILSDEASMVTGSIGMLSSASLREDSFGMYEPSHGSAPDIAGQNIANPIATILSAAMMLRYSFDLDQEAQDVEDALEKVLQDHKVEAQRQSEIRIKTETINAKQQINQSLAKAQLDLKREQSKIQQDLKDKIFKETLELVHDYMKSADYPDFLIRCIRDALTFANGSSMTIYINPSDESLKSSLEEATGTQLTISTEDFIGGVRCVIRDRNILIDHSFKTQLRDEYDKFLFSGGDGIA